jgi:hypothetical protein
MSKTGLRKTKLLRVRITEATPRSNETPLCDKLPGDNPARHGIACLCRLKQ